MKADSSHRNVSIFCIFLLSLVTVFSPASAQVSEVINANILSVEDGSIAENQYIRVDNGTIAVIGSMDDYTAKSEASVIDATGGYIVPGLAEMHAHIPPSSSGPEHTEETLFLYLSNGITTIRGMLGESSHLQLKQDVEEGEILGPRIYTSGPSLNGNSVQDVTQARTIVQAQAKAGYDFLKLHPGLKLDVFNEIVATANEVGIPYSGHVSIDVGIRNALNAKYASVDHVDGYVEGLVPETAGVKPNENGFFGINFTDIADEAMIPDLVTLTKENGVWVVPTQCLMERWVGPQDPEQLGKQPEMKYMAPSTVSRWIEIKKSYTSSELYDPAKANRFVELRAEIINQLQNSGVGLLLGSDAPQVFNVPGFSIRHEFNAMVSSGLTPLEVLQIGTINPARFFGDDGKYGVIKEDASADFVICKSNPLNNLQDFFDQSGVMVRGTWLSQQDIQERLSQIEEKHSR